jgi:hypothetical protein
VTIDFDGTALTLAPECGRCFHVERLPLGDQFPRRFSPSVVYLFFPLPFNGGY